MVSVENKSKQYPVTNSGKISQEGLQNSLSKSKQTVSDSFESNSISKVIAGEGDSSKTQSLLLVPALMLADNMVDALNGGAENKSLLSKFSKAGDKISHALHLDNIVSSETGSKISNFINNNRFLKYFTNTYKATPKSALAQSSKMSDKFSGELISALNKITSNEAFPEIAGSLSSETLNTLKNISDSTKASGVASGSLVRATDELIGKGLDVIDKGSFLKKSVSLTSLRNKLKAVSTGIGETSLGKGTAKAAIAAKEKFTFGGGLLSLFFTASALVNATKAAKEAPKGEKKSTFMHVLSEQYIGIILFQPSINLLYKIGGNKYRGMTPEALEAMKNIVKTSNADRTITKEGLKIARMQRDLLIKGVDKDKVATLAGKSLEEAKTIAKSLKGQGAKLKFWEKPLKLMGRILDTGLDKIQKAKYVKLPVIGEKNIAHSLKGFLGGAARFAIIMMVLQPLLQKPVTKLCHKIFGKPVTYLAKQEAKSGNTQSEQQTQNVQQPSNNDTNFLNRWTQLPASAEINLNNNEVVKNDVSAASAISADVQPVKPAKAEEQPVAALNLFKKRYIPVVEAPADDSAQKEKVTNKKVKIILDNTEKVMNNAKKVL